MPKLKQPKRPKIGASARTWKTYETKLNKYVAAKNETKRRRELKENTLSKIKE